MAIALLAACSTSSSLYVQPSRKPGHAYVNSPARSRLASSMDLQKHD